MQAEASRANVSDHESISANRLASLVDLGGDCEHLYDDLCLACGDPTPAGKAVTPCE